MTLADGELWRVDVGDCRDLLRRMPAGSAQCCVTSPPYFGLRDYGVAGQIGLEPSPAGYVAAMVEVFAEVRRVLRDDGTVWLNLGDSYANDAKGPNGAAASTLEGALNQPSPRKPWRGEAKKKDLLGIPWQVAFALRDAGWYLRSEIIWSKRSPMPESVTDRPTKAHEQVFLLAKRSSYFYDAAAVAEPATGTSDRPQRRRAEELAREAGLTDGHLDAIRAAGATDVGRAAATQDGTGKNTADVRRLAGEAKEALGGYYREFLVDGNRNLRSVWTLSNEPYAGAHFATMPTRLVEPCVKAGTSEHGQCPACGAPWRRVVIRQPLWRERPNELVKRTGASGTGNSIPNTTAGVSVQTVGWQPFCDCLRDETRRRNPGAATGAEWLALADELAVEFQPIPQIVLDPFAGAGTVPMVARRLGRRAYGCELNPDYAALARRRIADDMPLFNGPA